MSADLAPTLNNKGLPESNKSAGLEGIGNDYKYGFSDKEDYIFKSGRGLTREIVEKITFVYYSYIPSGFF